MPYNQGTRTFYFVDYKQLCLKLVAKFKSNKAFQNHIVNWFEKLSLLDKNVQPCDYEQMNQFNINVDNIKFFVHFNVEEILKAINNDKLEYFTSSVLLKSFTEPNRNYYYDENAPGVSFTNAPIVVTKRPSLQINSQYKNDEFFVLDGNNRVKAAIKNKISRIETRHINIDSMIHSKLNLFIDPYDRFLFAFLTELTYAIEQLKLHKIPLESIIQKSILND